ncbi:MAG: hypothetical protein ACREFE_10565 [Limisphaerales bacterium]
MGRPKLPKGTANSVQFAFKIAPQDAETIDSAVKRSGMTKPDWAREKLIQAAKQA